MNTREENPLSETELQLRELRELRDQHINQLKVDINEFLFQRLPSQSTLQEMENIAEDIYIKIMDSFDLIEDRIQKNSSRPSKGHNKEIVNHIL